VFYLIEHKEKVQILNVEKTKELISEVVTEFCGEFDEQIIPILPDLSVSQRHEKIGECLQKFTQSPNNLMLVEELLNDNQSIPSMYWRAMKAPAEARTSAKKLLQYYLRKRLMRNGTISPDRVTMAGTETPYPRPSTPGVPPTRMGTRTIRVGFASTRSASYTNIAMQAVESLRAVVNTIDLEDYEPEDLPYFAEDEGDIFEIDWDTADYDVSWMELVDSYDTEVEVDFIVYTDSEGEEHELSFDGLRPEGDEIREMCDEIEDEIAERLEQEGEDI